jgi:hypothetical protein
MTTLIKRPLAFERMTTLIKRPLAFERVIPNICVIMLLSACAITGTEMKAECESKFSKFPDIYRCTYDAVTKQNPDILKDPRGKLYLLRGEQLTQEVEGGKLSDIDAKVIWQEQLVKLRSENEKEASAIMNSMPKTTTMPTYQLPTGKQSINCTSQQFGSTVNTNCR